MGLKDCLATALDGGEITKSQHDRLQKRFDQLQKKYGIDSGSTAAERAKQSLLAELKAESAEKSRRAKLALAAVKSLSGEADGWRNAAGQKDVGTYFLYKLESYGAGFESVAGREKEIMSLAQTRLSQMMQHFERTFLAGDYIRKNRAQLPNVLREAMGEDTGDAAAKTFAAAWLDTAEWLRQRFNAAGGSIGKLENWGMPQRHSPMALRDQGPETWKAYIRPLLAVDKMRHPLTQEPVTAGELDEILQSIFDGIVTDGWDTREPTGARFGKGAIATQRADHRFLIFRDADAWLKYQRDFGGGEDIFAAMMSHVRGMSRDIAAMEMLGPNPEASLEWMRQVIKKAGQLKLAGKESRLPGKTKSGDNVANMRINRLNEVWDTMRGNSGHPVNATLARIGGGTRNWITASLLGSSVLSAVSDVGTSIIARHFAGIHGLAAVGDYITALTPAGKQDAMDLGIILDEAMNAFHQEARFVGSSDVFGKTAYVADRVISISGLAAWTRTGKFAWGLGFAHELARSAGKPWEGLDPALRRTFTAYGLTPKDWDGMRAVPVHVGQSGLRLLRPADIAKIDERLAGRYLGMMQMESEYAVPTGGYRSRSALLGNTRAGTWQGEGLRSFAHLKGFGAAYIILHGARLARMAIGRDYGSAVAYAGALLISSTVFGALARQLSAVAATKDPEPMNTPAFWTAAMMKGGGLGIYGDFLFSETNRYGGGLAETISGTVTERAASALRMAGSAYGLLTGQDQKLGRELIQFAKGNIPGGNIWFLRAAWERMVLDQVQGVIDPEANKAFKRKQRDAAKNYGQGFWWQPGQWTPSRAPDIGNVLASRAAAGG